MFLYVLCCSDTTVRDVKYRRMLRVKVAYEFMHPSIVFCAACTMSSKESSRSLSHLPMSFLLKQLRDSGMAKRKAGSCQPSTARTDENINHFDELVLSHEEAPHSYILI